MLGSSRHPVNSTEKNREPGPRPLLTPRTPAWAWLQEGYLDPPAPPSPSQAGKTDTLGASLQPEWADILRSTWGLRLPVLFFKTFLVRIGKNQLETTVRNLSVYKTEKSRDRTGLRHDRNSEQGSGRSLPRHAGLLLSSCEMGFSHIWGRACEEEATASDNSRFTSSQPATQEEEIALSLSSFIESQGWIPVQCPTGHVLRGPGGRLCQACECAQSGC